MRKLLLFLFALTASQITFAQCDEIFISEYVHGISNNRAIELYNPTAAAVNLADYRINRWSNGNDLLDMLYVEPLSGMIQPESTFVIVSDKRDPNGTGLEEPIHGFLEAKADLFLGLDYNINRCFFFNGNDAMTLEKNVGGTWQVVDIVGEPGVDPGNGWTDDASANFTDANGGTWTTRRRTLIRKYDRMEGSTWTFASATIPPNPSSAPNLEDGPAPFNAVLDWDTMPRQAVFDSTYADSLGAHRCACSDLTSVGPELPAAKINVSPNPATANQLRITAQGYIQKVTMFNIIGQKVIDLNFTPNNNSRTIEIRELDNGPYFLKVTLSEGNEAIRKIIVNH